MTPLPRFLQFHTLTSYPGVLLNRDDAGLAKRLPYGGTVRTRVSSQCLKRHWRTAEDAEWGFDSTGALRSVRSREVFEYAIQPRVLTALPDANKGTVVAAGAALSRGLYGKKADDVKKRQALLFGWREVEYLAQVVVDVVREAESAEAAADAIDALFKDKESKVNLSRMKTQAGELTAGLEAALFGRMVTSDPAANTDAAIHVAHAFTVHAQESETDYFTVVDDLRSVADDQDAGSAGIFDTELTSGLFYGYVVVDVPLLVANLTGRPPGAWAEAQLDRSLAASVIESLVHLIATVSPGAKRGSTAPYAWSNCMLIEAGSRQPRSLAGAFERAIQVSERASLSQLAERALFERAAAFDKAFGAKESRKYLSLLDEMRPIAGESTTLDSLAQWAAQCVERASVPPAAEV